MGTAEMAAGADSRPRNRDKRLARSRLHRAKKSGTGRKREFRGRKRALRAGKSSRGPGKKSLRGRKRSLHESNAPIGGRRWANPVFEIPPRPLRKSRRPSFSEPAAISCELGARFFSARTSSWSLTTRRAADGASVPNPAPDNAEPGPRICLHVPRISFHEHAALSVRILNPNS